jgi:uncharacterized damage-inducible protein DinB
MLRSFLDFQRATVRAKVAGLTDDEARRHLLDSSRDLTLGGLVSHLTGVERAWFRIVLAGEAVDGIDTSHDPKGLAIGPEHGLQSLVASYEQECEAADRAAERFDLDDEARMPGRTETLRWIYCHMIEESARHLGHMDLLHESIDGAKGE